MHDYVNQFNIKWEKNQFGGRKVAGQGTILANWVQQKVGGSRPSCPVSCATNGYNGLLLI